MSYLYKEERQGLFTEDGQVLFLAIRDNVQRLLKVSGAVRMQEAVSVGMSYSMWRALACVDRLVELGELREVHQVVGTHGQDRVFVDGRTGT